MIPTKPIPPIEQCPVNAVERREKANTEWENTGRENVLEQPFTLEEYEQWLKNKNKQD
jgi:hypothetical protein